MKSKKIKKLCAILIVMLLFLYGAVLDTKANDIVFVTISFAGDCTLGSDLRYGKNGSFIEVFEKQEDPYGYFFKNVKPIFEKDDLTVVNLEGPLTDAPTKADKQFAFKGYPSFTNILKEGGVDLVNLANNHTNDYGSKGHSDTLYHLDDAGIAYYGLDKPFTETIKGVTVGVLGYKGFSAGKDIKKKIEQDISLVKTAGAHIVIVSFHWGDEGKNDPNNTQKTLGRWAAESGADLVIGHHPHVIQGIEQYNGTYIVYSLGNFSFGGNRNPSDKDTFIFQQTFAFDGDTLERTLEKDTVHIYPCSISSDKSFNSFQPTLLAGGDAQRVMDRLERYSDNLNQDNIISQFAVSSGDG